MADIKEKRIAIRLKKEEYQKLEKLKRELEEKIKIKLTISDVIRHLINNYEDE